MAIAPRAGQVLTDLGVAELGISQGQLSRYEQGSSEIGAEILLRFARRTGRTIEWLLTGKDSA